MTRGGGNATRSMKGLKISANAKTNERRREEKSYVEPATSRMENIIDEFTKMGSDILIVSGTKKKNVMDQKLLMASFTTGAEVTKNKELRQEEVL